MKGGLDLLWGKRPPIPNQSQRHLGEWKNYKYTNYTPHALRLPQEVSHLSNKPPLAGGGAQKGLPRRAIVGREALTHGPAGLP